MGFEKINVAVIIKEKCKDRAFNKKYNASMSGKKYGMWCNGSTRALGARGAVRIGHLVPI